MFRFLLEDTTRGHTRALWISTEPPDLHNANKGHGDMEVAEVTAEKVAVHAMTMVSMFLSFCPCNKLTNY